LSGKGGVGKTTLVSNLGAALIKKGKDVIILDANVTTPNLSLHLGIPFYPITLHDVLEEKHPIDSAVYHHPSGLKIIPASLNVDSVKNTNLEKFEKILLNLLGRADIILIDSAPGLCKEAMVAMNISDEIIVVTNPELPAITDALRTIKIAEEEGVNVLGVVVNRVKGHKHEISLSEIKSMLGVPIIEVIPEDINVPISISKMKPVVYYKPKSKASKRFHRIASKILGEPVTKIKESWIDRLLFWLI
jgi:septum site-determining protein MinD